MHRTLQKALNTLIVTAILVAPLTLPTTSQAAPPRVKGMSCGYQKIPRGTWIGYFDGVKESAIISFGDQYSPVTLRRCFKSQADCKAWKYWVQTDYPVAIRAAWCRQK
jgi:hypothetical protein